MINAPVCAICARGEMDITTGFGPVIVGSSPAGRTKTKITRFPW